jgi:hypothetical protein
VQFIAPDGHVASAAAASFLTLSHAPGKGFWLALYRNLPGFATISERAYAFIAARRPAFFRASLLLWGRNHEPPRYDLVSFLFLRLFGLIYLSAFVSFAVQAQGLIGSHGILPLTEMVDDLAGRLGPQRFFLMPMFFWINASDAAIQAVCWAGAGLSLMLVFNLLPRVTPVSALCPLPLAVLRRANLHELPVGHVPLGRRVCRASDELRHDAGRLARALALVPLHVHVGRRQAFERRSQLVEFVGAQLSLSDPTAADAARVVRRAAAARPLESGNRRHVFRRARSAIPDLLPASPAIFRGLRHPAAAKLHSHHRQL